MIKKNKRKREKKNLTAAAPDDGEGTDAAGAFLGLLRDVSVPLASERFGDPIRLRPMPLGFFKASVCLGRPDGVLAFVLESLSFSCSLPRPFSSSVFLSSSFSFSASLSSEVD